MIDRRSLRIRILVSVITAASLLIGCGTRSISDSGYYADSDRGYAQRSNPFYKGELSEFDVLGIDSTSEISEAEIQSALSSKLRITVPKGSSLMLIQSGAMIPDANMVSELENYYNVSVFTGIPSSSDSKSKTYANALRLAAAKGGYSKIVVYWGLLETGRENMATKAVSWVPIVGWAVPDETQRMRIRMKVAIIDVKSGQWDMFSPEPFEDIDSSGHYSRVSSDQGQVAVLKEKAYSATVRDLVKRYSK